MGLRVHGRDYTCDSGARVRLHRDDRAIRWKKHSLIVRILPNYFAPSHANLHGHERDYSARSEAADLGVKGAGMKLATYDKPLAPSAAKQRAISGHCGRLRDRQQHSRPDEVG